MVHSLHILCIFRDLQPLYKSYIGKRHSKYKTVVIIIYDIKMNLLVTISTHEIFRASVS